MKFDASTIGQLRMAYYYSFTVEFEWYENGNCVVKMFDARGNETLDACVQICNGDSLKTVVRGARESAN